MATERTLSIIKPDAVERNKIGEITAMLENAGLRVVASKRLKLDQAKASQFYEVHKERPFFQSLCDFMCSGPIVVQVREGENAVKRNREIIVEIPRRIVVPILKSVDETIAGIIISIENGLEIPPVKYSKILS